MSAKNKVVVTRGRILFPNLYPVCLSAGPSSLQSITSDYGKFSGYYVFFTTRKQLVTQVAICTDCVGKERRLQKYSRALAVLGFLVALGVTVHFDLGSSGWAFGVAFCAPVFFFRNLLASQLGSIGMTTTWSNSDSNQLSMPSILEL